MAYEKLSVVYEYRDDPADDSEEENIDKTNSDDWWKEESQKDNKNNKKGFLFTEQKHNYGKLPVTGSPEKSPTGQKDDDPKTNSKSPESERKTMSERFKGAISSASEGLTNWFLTSSKGSVPVDTFMCGGDGPLSSDTMDRAYYSSRVAGPYRYW